MPRFRAGATLVSSSYIHQFDALALADSRDGLPLQLRGQEPFALELAARLTWM
jgi:hypothetical protein